MARMVRHEGTGPVELKPNEDGKSHWVCMCGLSQDMPLCDGSHKNCRKDGGEEEGKLYVYNKDRTAVDRVDEDA